ncbi:hypothetical protein PCANC_07528 [Puccinia coronata f. sp. avenae]|uniref:Uncharacterized protein n=1 Tax=Puccinia coronata f. sp. avenae TaxID=200324 RepID=A0A2N5VSJ6_9BASI|nr:hypothetical protein PCANC_07528 [Puccinia coronata f. sp. avenae]
MAPTLELSHAQAPNPLPRTIPNTSKRRRHAKSSKSDEPSNEAISSDPIVNPNSNGPGTSRKSKGKRRVPADKTGGKKATKKPGTTGNKKGTQKKGKKAPKKTHQTQSTGAHSFDLSRPIPGLQDASSSQEAASSFVNVSLDDLRATVTQLGIPHTNLKPKEELICLCIKYAPLIKKMQTSIGAGPSTSRTTRSDLNQASPTSTDGDQGPLEACESGVEVDQRTHSRLNSQQSSASVRKAAAVKDTPLHNPVGTQSDMPNNLDNISPKSGVPDEAARDMTLSPSACRGAITDRGRLTSPSANRQTIPAQTPAS